MIPLGPVQDELFHQPYLKQVYHPHLEHRFLRLTQIRWNVFINMPLNMASIPRNFRSLLRLRKKDEFFRTVLENDMQFYRGAIERKVDPRKYYLLYTFLTDRDRLIGVLLL